MNICTLKCCCFYLRGEENGAELYVPGMDHTSCVELRTDTPILHTRSLLMTLLGLTPQFCTSVVLGIMPRNMVSLPAGNCQGCCSKYADRPYSIHPGLSKPTYFVVPFPCHLLPETSPIPSKQWMLLFSCSSRFWPASPLQV